MMLWIYERLQMFAARRSINLFCFISRVFKKTGERYLEKIENDIKDVDIPELTEAEKEEMYQNIIRKLKERGIYEETEEN